MKSHACDLGQHADCGGNGDVFGFLLISILRRPDGVIDSMVILTSEDGRDPRDPTPGLLREVQSLIAHHLEHHATP